MKCHRKLSCGKLETKCNRRYRFIAYWKSSEQNLIMMPVFGINLSLEAFRYFFQYMYVFQCIVSILRRNASKMYMNSFIAFSVSIPQDKKWINCVAAGCKILICSISPGKQFTDLNGWVVMKSITLE